MQGLSRRAFLAGGSIAGLAVAEWGHAQPPGGKRPLAISSANGLGAVARAMEILKAGGDPLDAAIAGVNLVEDDPKDNSVGYGGLPNEDGVVELDSAVMHGPTARGGAVASLRNIRHPSKVARLVMERTDHVLIVGEGALRFAKAHGFKEEDLLTEESRRIWLRWKETLSEEDDWLPPTKPERTTAALRRRERPTGTIHVSALTAAGDMGSCTTTSGLAFKIPGRVGDSPILGAGIYTDNEVGSAGSTGRGEANLLNCSSFLIVELMRQGKTPEAACLEVCKRIVDKNKEPRLRHKNGRPNFEVKFYALDKQGRHGSASIYKGSKYAVHDGTSARLLPSAYLYESEK